MMEKRNVATTARVRDDGMDGVLASAARCLAGARESVKKLAEVARGLPEDSEAARAAMAADEAAEAESDNA